MNLKEYITDQQAKSFNDYMQEVIRRGSGQPDYYPKRKYGKWTIYNKEGMRVAWGMNEREMKAYMKLLKEEN
jgi:hypothetical protein